MTQFSMRPTLPHAYAGIIENESLLNCSASGGVFAGFAIDVLYSGGSVFGCSMDLVDGKLVPHHIKIIDEAELYRLQGSKYVFSNIKGIYPQVISELLQGKQVLFSGTPCQVAGLNIYLHSQISKNNDPNLDLSRLITVDLICHGTPSISLFQDYIDFLRIKLNAKKIIEFRFRDKSKGWGYLASITYESNNGKFKRLKLNYLDSSYYHLFIQCKIHRIPCYTCKYANSFRVGDITIGDYWGIEKEHPEYLKKNGGLFSEQSGISCVIVNTNKGAEFLNSVDGVTLVPSTLEKIKKYQAQLSRPPILPPEREEIFSLYKTGGYAAIDAWWKKRYLQFRVQEHIKLLIPNRLRKMIKKVIKKKIN